MKFRWVNNSDILEEQSKVTTCKRKNLIGGNENGNKNP